MTTKIEREDYSECPTPENDEGGSEQMFGEVLLFIFSLPFIAALGWLIWKLL